MDTMSHGEDTQTRETQYMSANHSATALDSGLQVGVALNDGRLEKMRHRKQEKSLLWPPLLVMERVNHLDNRSH